MTATATMTLREAFTERLGRAPTSEEMQLAVRLKRLPNRGERRAAGIGKESGTFERRVAARTDARPLTKAGRAEKRRRAEAVARP